MVDPERAEPEAPGPTVEQAAEHAGRVEPRDAQPVDRAVRRRPARRCGSRTGTRSRRSAGTATAPPRSGRPAPSGSVRLSCRHPWSVPSAVARDQLVRLRRPPRAGCVGCTGGGESSSGCMIRQVSSTPSWRVNRVCRRPSRRAAAPRRRRALAALVGELHVELDRAQPACVGAWPHHEPDAGGGSSLMTNWSGSGCAADVSRSRASGAV